MEELAQDDADEEKQIILNRGPFSFEDTLEFGTIFRTKETYEYRLFIKKLPDARTQKIITDFSKDVDMTTFIYDTMTKNE